MVSGENVPRPQDLPKCSCGAARIFEFQVHLCVLVQCVLVSFCITCKYVQLLNKQLAFFVPVCKGDKQKSVSSFATVGVISMPSALTN